MKFDCIISNPPFIDKSVGKNAGKLYDKIFKLSCKISGKVVFLCPRRFIRSYKQMFTGFEFQGNFPGVNQAVGIFERDKNKPLINDYDPIKWNFPSREDDAKLRLLRKKWILEHQVKNSISLIWMGEKSVLKKGEKVPDGCLGVVNNSTKFNCFLPGEIPVDKKGNYYGTAYLLKYDNPSMLKKHLVQYNELYREFNKTVGNYAIFRGFHRCVPMPEEKIRAE